MTTLQRQHAVEYATRNNIKFDAKSLVGEESLKTQASALAYAAKNNINVTKVNQIAGSYAKYKTDNFKNVVRSTVSYSGKDFSVNNELFIALVIIFHFAFDLAAIKISKGSPTKFLFLKPKYERLNLLTSRMRKSSSKTNNN